MMLGNFRVLENINREIYSFFKTPPGQNYSIVGFRKIIIVTILIILLALAVFINIPHPYPVNKLAIYFAISISLALLVINTKMFSENFTYPLYFLIPLLIFIMTLVAVIVHFTGDTESPFFFLYYLPIIAAGWRYNPNIVFVPAVFGVLFISAEWILPYLFLPKSFSQFITGSPYPALILRSFTLIFVAAFVYFLARARNESGLRLLDTISKLKKSAKELEDEKSRGLALAAALTNIGDGVFLVDTNKKILDWNRAMEKFTGIPSSDAIAKNVYKMLSVYNQLGRNVCMCASRNCKKTDNINNHNEIVFHKNSQLICPKSFKSLNINHVSTPLIDTKGNVFASLEIIHNIEHEKQMTDISQLSQAIVHITSLEETIDAILPKIAQSLHSQKAIITIQHQNKNLILKHFGFEKSQSNKIKLFNYDPTVKIFSNNLQKESTGNSQLIKELKINKIMQSPLISRNQLFGSIAVINKKIGIFEKKDWRYFKNLTAYITRIIENAIIYQDLSDNLDRERQFIGDIAHEFKTPLTIIKSETELAISRNRSIGYYQKTLESIFSSVNILSSRLKNVLDLTWSKTLKDEEASEVDVTSLVSDILEIAEKLAFAKKIKVESKLNAKVKIMGSRERLAQAILNIIDNAIKYTPSGGKVKLSVGKVNGNVKISISDTGMGIPKSEISRIFDRFYRGLKHDRRLGSGLGLAISKSIVSAYKGQIVTKSKVGKGTSFNLTFPIYKH